MSASIHVITGDLTLGRWYRIARIDPTDPDPSLKVGDVVECAAGRPNCIDPECMIGDGMGVQWFADFDGVDAYRTLVSCVEEVEKPELETTCPHCLEALKEDEAVEGPKGHLWHQVCLEGWREE